MCLSTSFPWIPPLYAQRLVHPHCSISISNRLACLRFIWKKNIANSSTDHQNEKNQKLLHLITFVCSIAANGHGAWCLHVLQAGFLFASTPTNYLEKQHSKHQHHRKRTNTKKKDLDATEKPTDAAQAMNDQNLEDE